MTRTETLLGAVLIFQIIFKDCHTKNIQRWLSVIRNNWINVYNIFYLNSKYEIQC